jgi:hypothetical protein
MPSLVIWSFWDPSPVTKLFGYAPSIRNHTSSSSVVLKPKRKLLVVLGHYLDYIHCRDSIRTGLHMAETKWSSTHARTTESQLSGRARVGRDLLQTVGAVVVESKRWAQTGAAVPARRWRDQLHCTAPHGSSGCLSLLLLGQGRATHFKT